MCVWSGSASVAGFSLAGQLNWTAEDAKKTWTVMAECSGLTQGNYGAAPEVYTTSAFCILFFGCVA